MDAPQYVHAYVPAENPCPWIFNYTHHNGIDALQYVQVDVPSDV